MAIDNSKSFETVLIDCGREFYKAITLNKQYLNSRWDMKFAPSTCKYNMFGVKVLPGIFQWIVATKWAAITSQTNGNGGVFARGAPIGKGLEIFNAFFPFPLASALPEAPGDIDAIGFELQIGFYEKPRDERTWSDIPEMNMEFKVVSKAKNTSGYPLRGYVMNLHVQSPIDTNLASGPHIVFRDFGFTLTDPSGNASTIHP